MESKLPIVSVVALCYNQEAFVIQTLNSIRSQTYKNIELIITDDASTDNSVNVIEDWIKENKIQCRFIKHLANVGLCKTLNETFNFASGEFYKIIACDDELLPGCIETLANTLNALPSEYAMVYGDLIHMDEKGKSYGQTTFAERGWQNDSDVPSGNLFIKLTELCFIPAPAVLMRTEIIKALRFDETLYFEDWDMWLNISKNYLIKGISAPVVKYRIHSGSMYQKKNSAFLDSELRTLEKHRGFNAIADKNIDQSLYKKSILLYMQNGKNPLHWLWERFLIKKTFKNFAHVLFAFCNISYSTKKKWFNS